MAAVPEATMRLEASNHRYGADVAVRDEDVALACFIDETADAPTGVAHCTARNDAAACPATCRFEDLDDALGAIEGMADDGSRDAMAPRGAFEAVHAQQMAPVKDKVEDERRRAGRGDSPWHVARAAPLAANAHRVGSGNGEAACECDDGSSGCADMDAYDTAHTRDAAVASATVEVVERGR
eukprot:6930018-Prymnesium_polylepis.1